MLSYTRCLATDESVGSLCKEIQDKNTWKSPWSCTSCLSSLLKSWIESKSRGTKEMRGSYIRDPFEPRPFLIRHIRQDMKGLVVDSSMKSGQCRIFLHTAQRSQQVSIRFRSHTEKAIGASQPLGCVFYKVSVLHKCFFHGVLQYFSQWEIVLF